VTPNTKCHGMVDTLYGDSSPDSFGELPKIFFTPSKKAFVRCVPVAEELVLHTLLRRRGASVVGMMTSTVASLMFPIPQYH